MSGKIGFAVLVVFAVIGALVVVGALGMLLMHGAMMGGFMCGDPGSSEATLWPMTMPT